jgi:hypothetical protein
MLDTNANRACASSSNEFFPKTLVGSHGSSDVIGIHRRVSNSSLVGAREEKLQVDPCIDRGIVVPVSGS